MKDGGPDVFGCCYGRASGTPQRRELVANQKCALSARDVVAIATRLDQAGGLWRRLDQGRVARNAPSQPSCYLISPEVAWKPLPHHCIAFFGM
jgi:hypothetical protein